jgi:hypothetical protein
MGTLLHVSCAGVSRDLSKSSAPSVSGNRSLNTSLSANLTVLEVQMSCQMQYQNHVQSLNVMFVKRHENIGIFKSIFSNRAIRKSQPAKIQNTT